MRLSPAQLKALRAIMCHYRVWHDWSQSEEDKQQAMLWTGQRLRDSTIDWLVRNGLIKLHAYKPALYDGLAPQVTELGMRILDEHLGAR